MKSTLLLLAVSLCIFTGCSTAYKTGQTPDDVYFSPARPQDEYVQSEKDKDEYSYREDYDDRYLRMKVRNRTRWSDFNDWYSYERYGFGYNYIYGSYNNPYNSWNYYHNPYCGPVYLGSKNLVISRPRVYNLGVYNTSSTASNKNNFRYTNSNTRYNSTYTAPRNSSRSRDRDAGNTLRDIFRSNNSNSSSNNNSNSKPANTSSSSPSGTKSTAPVRRF
jgi:hypothetical protein